MSDDYNDLELLKLLDNLKCERDLREQLEQRNKDFEAKLLGGASSSEKEKSLVAKLKTERALRETLNTNFQILEAKTTVLERKYRSALANGYLSEVGDQFKIQVEELNSFAIESIDSDNVSEKIRTYHSSLNKKAYNHVWKERLDLILNVISSGELSLPRVLASVRRAEERKRKMGFDNYPWVVNDKPIDLPWRPMAAAYRSAVFEVVMDCVSPNTRKIIETGSGWGEHIM